MKDIEHKPKVDETKSIPLDFYQKSLKNEEAEVSQRTEAEDQEMFNQICKQIKLAMKEILRLKIEKPDQWISTIEEKKIKVLMLTLSMRKLGRNQKVRVKNDREKTCENRQKVDAATLQLQNLLYEVSHLKKEVRKCLEFEAADREIDLVPINQFYKEAPDNISRKEETENNPHQQRLAQLHWELEQRRGQTQLFDKLTQEKDAVSAIISDQESKLASLRPRINTILEATRPLQDALDLPLDANKEQQRISQWLPSPLYTLWVQVGAYGEACDSGLECSIEGDAEAARKIATTDDDESEASDSDQEIEAPDDARKKKKRRDSQDSEALKILLATHPLYLVLRIRTKESNFVVIKFRYASNLRIVTASCTLDLKEDRPGPLLTNILDGDTFLDLLFAGDLGIESPNPANEFHFQKLRLPSVLFSAENIKSLGKPYKWVQTLSGLSFLSKEVEQQPPETNEEELDLDESSQDSTLNSSLLPKLHSAPKVTETLSWKKSAEHVHQIVSSIKRRLQARLSLSQQLAKLENAKCTSDIPVPAEVLQQHFPGKVSSEMKSWKPITFQEYGTSPSTAAMIKNNIVTSNFLTFKAIYNRETVSMDVLVAISPDYPNDQPLFSLTLLWGQEPVTALTDPHVRQMECEVNVHWPELVSNRRDKFHVLSLQLYRLAMCFDILTEAMSTHISSDHLFHKEKIFFRSARGPDRSLPFKYLPKLGVFAQR